MYKPKVILSHAGVQYSYPLAHALQQAGFLKTFWTTYYSFSSNNRIGYFGRRNDPGLRKELIQSNPWPEFFQRGLSAFLPKHSNIRNYLIHWRLRFFDQIVASKLRISDFDTFIGLSGAALTSIQKAKAFGKRTVIDQHDIHFSLAERLIREEKELHPEFSSSMPYWPPMRQYLDCVHEELDLADFIFVPSTFALKSHLQAGIPAEKLIFLPHGHKNQADCTEREPKREGKFRILFVGQITQRKGIKYLLEAVKQLNHPEIELVMIGDQMSDERAIATYQDYFRYLGYVSYEGLNDYFKNSDVLVLPSVYDAFGLVALDAMSRGLPVIVSENTAAGSDVVRDGTDGYVVPIRNVEILKDRILALFTKRDLGIEMGRNARERVQQFSWNAYQENLKNTLEQKVYVS